MIRTYGLSNYGGLFGSYGRSGISSFYGNLSEYGNIRSGAYSKVMRSYYKKASQARKTQDVTTRVNHPSYYMGNIVNGSLSTAKTESNELVDAANRLADTGKNGLFADKDKYDRDEIYKAVSNFVDQYNDTVGSMDRVSSLSVKDTGHFMTRMTDIMSSSLSEVGITVDSDGRMSIDEETFNKADISKVKSLFNGNTSYAGSISFSASRIASQADNQLDQMNQVSQIRTGLYGSGGLFYGGYNSGSLFNRFF